MIQERNESADGMFELSEIRREMLMVIMYCFYVPPARKGKAGNRGEREKYGGVWSELKSI